jgi:hypothetical protein
VTGVIFHDDGATSCKGTRGVATELAKGKGEVPGAKNSDGAKSYIPAD